MNEMETVKRKIQEIEIKEYEKEDKGMKIKEENRKLEKKENEEKKDELLT